MSELRSGEIDPLLVRGLRVIKEWVRCWRILFSPKKYISVCFRGKTMRVEREFEAHLHSEFLPDVHVVRYSGVWFDKHLSWRKYLSKVTSHVRARVWQLRCMV